MTAILNRTFILWVFAGVTLSAQQETATLRGTVTDSNGAPVEGIPISVTAADMTVDTVRALTGIGGTFVAPYLKPGVYQISVEQRGYQTYLAQGIRLEAGEVRTIDPKVPAGAPEDAQPIRPYVPPIDTQTGTIRGVIDAKTRWQDAPVVDKMPSPFGLLITMPGVQGNGAGLVISGMSRDRQSWMSDGIADDAIPGMYVNPNYLDTMEAITANPAVETYRPTGLQLISKRGYNDLHGLVYYKHGSSLYDSHQYFNTGRTRYRLREWEAEIGGAVFKDRLFFFGSWTRQTNRYEQTLFANVPTALMRNRDFGQFLDPTTAPGGKTVMIRDPRSGAPFPNNQIPGTRVATVSTNVLNAYLPAPNTGDANSFVNNYSWVHRFAPHLHRGNWPLARIDTQLAHGHDLHFRFLETAVSAVTAGTVGEQLGVTQQRRYKNWAVSQSSALSSGMVNHFKIGYIENNLMQGEEEGDFTPVHGDNVLSTMGIQGANLKGYSVMGFPGTYIAGLTPLAMPFGGGIDKDLTRKDNIGSLEEGITWSVGKHALRMGVQYTRFHWRDSEIPLNYYGTFAFTGAYTLNAFADFLLGIPATTSRLQDPKLDQKSRQSQGGAWLADSFRVTSSLTLDYGVRWDYFGSPVHEDGYMYNWDPASGNVIVAPGTITSVSALYPRNIRVVVGDVVPKSKTTNFRPRFSAAYRLSENLVLRGGFGAFTDGGAFGVGNRLNDANGPYRIEEIYYNSITNGVAALSFPRPFPATLSAANTGAQTIRAIPLSTDEGILRQYNLTVERAVKELALRVSYIGGRGTGINYSLDVNKPRASAVPFSTSRLPYPQFGSAFVTRSDGEWRYDAAQFAASRRMGAVTFDAGFTFSRNRSNYLNTFDPYNVTSQWTRDAAERPRYFSGSASWALPFGKGKRYIANAGRFTNFAVSDWALHVLGVVASGQYYSPLFTGPDPANASRDFVTALPDCIGDPDSGAKTTSRWFNPGAFAIPAANAGRYGTCGMNVLEGYPIHVGHASLSKRLPINEWLSGVFTVQVSNLTNTPHFGFPNNNLSTPGAGAFTSAIPDFSPERQGTRQLDLKIRLQW